MRIIDNQEDVEDFLEMMLEDYNFEEVLEQFNLEPIDVFLELIKTGMIDEEELNDIMRTYNEVDDE